MQLKEEHHMNLVFAKSFAATWSTTLQVVDLAKTAKKHKPNSLQKCRD